jgi:hypothetical protein
MPAVVTLVQLNAVIYSVCISMVGMEACQPDWYSMEGCLPEHCQKEDLSESCF